MKNKIDKHTIDVIIQMIEERYKTNVLLKNDDSEAEFMAWIVEKLDGLQRNE